MKPIKLVVVAIVVALGTTFAFPQAKRIAVPPGSVVAGLPYSPAVRSGDLLFLAGSVGVDASDNLVPGGIQAQTRKAIENIETVLKADGMGLENVVLTKVYLSDSRLYGEMNIAYGEFFRDKPPARATLDADLALEGSLIEIQAIAVRPGIEKEVIRVPGEGANTRPYSRALRVGDYLFVAGLISQDLSTGNFAPGDIKAQTRQVLDNAKAFVAAAGFSMSDMTVSSVFLTDARDFSGMNAVYKTYFGDVPPTRATVRTRLMSADSKVEIMLWGVKREKERIGGGNSRTTQFGYQGRQHRVPLRLRPWKPATARRPIGPDKGRARTGSERPLRS
jgi:2-iminobutanoate/2-iminopropanoate deaminase